MYLFDLEANPSEAVTDGCGENKTLGPPAACGNLYTIPAFKDVRRKLEGLLSRAEKESVAPTLRWMDDGPLADPQNFGGWIPWRDRTGDPLASYEGVFVQGLEEPAHGSNGSKEGAKVSMTQMKVDMGMGGMGDMEGMDGIGDMEGMDKSEIDVQRSSISVAHAGGFAMFFAILAVGATFVAYRAGQRSGYHLLK